MKLMLTKEDGTEIHIDDIASVRIFGKEGVWYDGTEILPRIKLHPANPEMNHSLLLALALGHNSTFNVARVTNTHTVRQLYYYLVGRQRKEDIVQLRQAGLFRVFTTLFNAYLPPVYEYATTKDKSLYTLRKVLDKICTDPSALGIPLQEDNQLDLMFQQLSRAAPSRSLQVYLHKQVPTLSFYWPEILRLRPHASKNLEFYNF